MPKRPVPQSVHHRTIAQKLRAAPAALRERIDAFLRRRPHRSFQLTRRRDYRRTLTMPGYWRFTGEVWMVLWRYKKLFGLLVLLYIVLYLAFVGVVSQDAYQQVQSTISSISAGNVGAVTQGIALYMSTLAAGVSGNVDATKQTYAGLLGLLVWLTVVWLLRAIIAGKVPRLRDGIYNAGAPIVATLMVVIVMIIQALPVGIGAIAYGAATSAGLLDGGVEAMLFWTVFALLVVLSLYWMTSSFIALVIVTLPGMYPRKALKAAGDLVLGRRTRLLLRIIWALVIGFVVWTLVVLPMILFDQWIKSVWSFMMPVPFVPGTLLVMTGISLVFAASYIYLLYRRIVDDDAPAGQN